MKRGEMDLLLKKALRGAPPPASATCVDAERFAAWSEGSLSTQDAAEVERHLSECARCQSMLAVFAQTEPARPAVVPFWKRPIGWLVPVAAATAVVLVWVAIAKREPAAPAPLELAERASSPAQAAAPAAAPIPSASETRRDAPLNLDALANKDRKTKSETKAEASKPTARTEPAPVPAAATPPAARPVPAPQPVAAPPPPPAAFPAPRPAVAQAVPPAGTTGALSDMRRLTDAAAAATAKTAESATGVVEIVAGAPSQFDAAGPPATTGGLAAGGVGGGGGRGSAAGAGRGGAGRPVPVFASQVAPARWRILPSGKVEHSIDGGSTWDAIALESPTRLTGGTAPTATICWLIGRAGVVYRADDGIHFQRLTFPAAVDLVLIRATGAAQASITTSDGRVFTTADGGLTWLQGFLLTAF